MQFIKAVFLAQYLFNRRDWSILNNVNGYGFSMLSCWINIKVQYRNSSESFVLQFFSIQLYLSNGAVDFEL